jgi:predicted Zn finger-like uncharacterized protein
MILTCPACSTRYTIPDGQIGPAGRKVQCKACGHQWVQTPEGAAPVSAPPPPPPPPGPHKVYRARVEAEKRAARWGAAGSVWATAGTLALAALIGALWFRVDIVRAWPKAATAYAAIGMKTNVYGLEIENVRADRGKPPAPAGLSVSGVVSNVTQAPQPVPLLRVALLDADRREVTFWTVDSGRARLEPGDRASFVTALIEAPPQVAKVEVTFADEQRADGRAPLPGPPPALPAGAPPVAAPPPAAESGGGALAGAPASAPASAPP